MARPSTSSSAASGQSSGQQANGHLAPSSDSNTVRRSTQDSSKEDTDETPDRIQYDYADVQSPFTSKPLPYDPTLLPDGKRSLSSIGAQSFWLGFALATSLVLGAQTAYFDYPIWRLFAFVASLSLFHFLEYWTTATYNVPVVRASSFLLFTNGTAYNVAHTCAMLEIVVSTFAFPRFQAKYCNTITISIGLFLIIFGQATRSLAMATAGTNFNHTPQMVKKLDHELVTRGVYAYSRHPSYFAFFWWAIGTQLLVGNKLCLIAYVVVLWKFFHDRIQRKFTACINGLLRY